MASYKAPVAVAVVAGDVMLTYWTAQSFAGLMT